jgi:hypothetical protein
LERNISVASVVTAKEKCSGVMLLERMKISVAFISTESFHLNVLPIIFRCVILYMFVVFCLYIFILLLLHYHALCINFPSCPASMVAKGLYDGRAKGYVTI